MSALAADIDADSLADPATPRRWSIDQHLNASMVDALNAMHHTLIQVNSKSKVKAPAPISRPGFEVLKPRRMPTEIRERIRARNREGI